MKRIFKIIILLISFCFCRVYALYQVEYSEWSDVYPKGKLPIAIQSEERFLWYKDEIVDVEYLTKENVGNKKVDYEDFIYSQESEKSLEKPEELEDRQIFEKPEYTNYTKNEVYGIKINNINFKDNIKFSEIEVINKESSKKIDSTIDEKYNSLINGDLSDFIDLDGDINVKFNTKQDLNNIKVKLYYQCECENENSLSFNYLSKDDYSIYSKDYTLNTCTLEIDNSSLEEHLTKTTNYYTYIDKLYKTYNLKRDVTEDYYTNYEGYEKLESSSKMFYRYITNDKVYINEKGEIQETLDYCIKHMCSVLDTNVEVPEEEPEEEPKEEIVNPKTFDNIIYYVLLLILSFVLIFILFFKLIKNKPKMNNKSSFVESV